MQITFLGTGTSQGVPVIGCNCEICRSGDPRDKRFRTALMVEKENNRIIIDTGPDFRQQMLAHSIKSISGVLITHEHNDHIAGLDDLRSFNFATRQPVHIWAEERVMDVIHERFPYIFADNKYPGTPEIIFHHLHLQPFYIGEIKIEPIRLYHHKLPVLGFKIEKMAFLTDVSFIPPEEMKKLYNLDLLIIDALRIKPHRSHFNLEQASNIISELKPKQAKLIHISHYLGKHNEVKKQLAHNIEPAYDGLSINL